MTKKRLPRKTKKQLKKNLAWADIAAHAFYGMPPEMYQAGFRFDFKNSIQEQKSDGRIIIQFPLFKDGKPVVIHHSRPNTVGLLTGL